MFRDQLFLKILFGLVIAYLLAMLTFITFKYFLGLDASYLSALGSIFGATATCFATLVAYWLYNDWRAPHYLQKIAYEGQEIFKVTRQLKLSADKLLQLMKTKLQKDQLLNNGNLDSLSYNSIIEDLLNNVDDLDNLLEIYKYNFDTAIEFENNHLIQIKKCSTVLQNLYDNLSRPHYIDDYIGSVEKVRKYVSSGCFEKDAKILAIDLIDIVSKFNVDLLKNNLNKALN